MLRRRKRRLLRLSPKSSRRASRRPRKRAPKLLRRRQRRKKRNKSISHRSPRIYTDQRKSLDVLSVKIRENPWPGGVRRQLLGRETDRGSRKSRNRISVHAA